VITIDLICALEVLLRMLSIFGKQEVLRRPSWKWRIWTEIGRFGERQKVNIVYEFGSNPSRTFLRKVFTRLTGSYLAAILDFELAGKISYGNNSPGVDTVVVHYEADPPSSFYKRGKKKRGGGDGGGVGIRANT
jgi:hypothetical protein